MFKNTNSKRMTGILLALVLVTSVFIGGSIARYVTSTSSEDDARVAKWGFSETAEPITMNLFKNEYKLEDGTVVAKSNDDADIIAPGLNGVSKFKFVTSSVSPEVMYEVKISLDDSDVADEIKNHPGIQWKVDNGNWGTWDEMVSSLVSLSGDPSGMKVYAPGELHNNFKNTTDHTIAWQWVMDSGYDIEDTAMGNLATSGTPITAKIVVTVLAQQTDIDSTGMLEGNGSTFNLLDAQPLVFRANDNYEDFDRVEIDGTKINENTDYIAESGSIKITLQPNYLKTLSKGKHTISIISSNKTTKASFTALENINITHNGIIPEGAKYYTNIKPVYDEMLGKDVYYMGSFTNATVYNPGSKFPEPQNGDAFVYGDYEYRYNMKFADLNWEWLPNEDLDGWSVWVRDKTQNSYGQILSVINTKNVKDLSGLFSGCGSTTHFPAIPETATNINSMFYSSSLTTAPTIPSKVTNMAYAFAGCDNLNGTIEINAQNLTNYEKALEGTKIVKITGTISDNLKNAIATDSNLTLLEFNKNNNIIPNGGTYYYGGKGDPIIVLSSGELFPEPQMGDVYTFGEYSYLYVGIWEASLFNTSSTKTSYSTPLGKINDISVSLYGTYSGCRNLTTPPIIPEGVTDIRYAFEFCTALTTPPILPNSLESMDFAFSGCTALTTAPVIPSNVKTMNLAFNGCTNLNGTMVINANPTEFIDALYNTQITEITGSCPESKKQQILATKTMN